MKTQTGLNVVASLLMISPLAFGQTPPVMTPQMQLQVQQLMQQQMAAGATPGLTPVGTAAPNTNPAAGSGAQEDITHAKVKGTPRLLRDYPVPQVFFTDISDTYYLPTSEDYNRIMGALTTGLQKKLPISMIVNKKTKMILDVDTSKLPGSSSGSLYDDVPDDSSGTKPTSGGAAPASVPAERPAGTPSYVPAGGIMPPSLQLGGGGGASAPAPKQSGWSQ